MLTTMRATSVGKGKKALFVSVMLALIFTVLEILFFVTGKVLQSKWGMWRAPVAAGDKDRASYERYRERRDPLLGWPFPSQYGADLDLNGAQRNIYFPNGFTQGSCVSMYGDSFTQGGDTSSPEKNWGNVLSQQLGCYVANFGMGGYGTDQAYLRFERNRDDPSKVVIFGFHTDDVLRNLTRIRDLLSYDMGFAIKPRFIIDQQHGLTLIPMPDLTYDEYRRAVGAAGDLLRLEHENFQPGGPAGVVKLEFPYTVSVVNNMMRFHGFRARLLRRPEWVEFMERNHPLDGLQITVGLTRKFVELARQRGKKPLVVILPHSSDFRYFARTGKWSYWNVTEEYTRNGIPFVDFGAYLAEHCRVEHSTVETYFGSTGHYNDAGNAILARFVHDRVTQALRHDQRKSIRSRQ
jgi:hypothetical protein